VSQVQPWVLQVGCGCSSAEGHWLSLVALGWFFRRRRS
jgi:MYXO-CTERM domain-containing protein